MIKPNQHSITLNPISFHPQSMIRQYQRSHGLHDDHGAGNHTWIVSALSFYGQGFAFSIEGFLVAHDSRHGLERHPEIDVHAIGNTALDATRVVG